ncbi:MAG TPA: anhydro-N-acetylmuramic acid kinase, partial [Albitalea sp.]|nr:anhydro-N-acetylmuramic acid kinase [Albitalea sp.]
MANLYIGLMSGTSLDGVDGVLVEFPNDAALHVRAHAHHPFTAEFAHELLSLNHSGSDELHRAALAGNALARVYAKVVNELLAHASVAPSEVSAIGAHGQTVRHQPQQFDGTGYTIQLNNAALLAELCGIDVVADFRSRDVAAGGQGAPLVPAFHRAVFGRADEALAVINIGGISNLTALAADGSTVGFDCGPGNALMDHWCRQHTGHAFDRDGAWAASGVVIDALLSALQREPYFAQPAPKSTGRDLFNASWLAARLASLSASPRPQDVQATLTELTAWACADAVGRHATDARRVLVCGGGALNSHLMHRLASRLPGVTVQSTEAVGLPVDQVEAAAFAWLAKAFIQRQPGNLAAVTGAAGPRILGAL